MIWTTTTIPTRVFSCYSYVLESTHGVDPAFTNRWPKTHTSPAFQKHTLTFWSFFSCYARRHFLFSPHSINNVEASRAKKKHFICSSWCWWGMENPWAKLHVPARSILNLNFQIFLPSRSIWFLSLPFFVLLSNLVIANYWQHTIVTCGNILVQSVVLGVFTWKSIDETVYSTLISAPLQSLGENGSFRHDPSFA